MMRKLFKLPRGRLDRTVWGGEKWQWLETCPERLPDMKIDFCLHPASKPCPRCLGNALPGGCHQLSKELAKSRGSWIDPKSDNLHHGMAGAPKNFRSAQVSLSFDSALSLILYSSHPALLCHNSSELQPLWATVPEFLLGVWIIKKSLCTSCIFRLQSWKSLIMLNAWMVSSREMLLFLCCRLTPGTKIFSIRAPGDFLVHICQCGNFKWLSVNWKIKSEGNGERQKCFQVSLRWRKAQGDRTFVKAV